MTDPLNKNKIYPDITASRVIISAGVLGSLELLFRCRDTIGSLPNISRQLGNIVRTNSEAIVGALSRDPNLDLSSGTTVSSAFYPEPNTHITQTRFPKGFSFNKWYFGPLVDHDNPLTRALLTLGKLITRPGVLFKNWTARNWHQRMTILTVMQDLDNQISFKYGRSLTSFFLKRRLKTIPVKGNKAPTNLRVANKAARTLAQNADSIPMNVIMESMGNLSFTAHILGGCHMGSSPDNGIIDTNHQVFGYPGLFVIDGSAISANVGVNPSLTIAAMAERATDLMPAKNEL